VLFNAPEMQKVIPTRNGNGSGVNVDQSRDVDNANDPGLMHRPQRDRRQRVSSESNSRNSDWRKNLESLA